MNAEDRLRNDLLQISDVLPALGVDLEATLGRGRHLRRRKMIVATAAAAAIVAVGVGGASLVSDFDRNPRPIPPVETPPQETSPSPAETTPAPSASFDRIEPVLREWLTAIRNSDEDAAWSLMTPEAQATVGRDAFDQMMQSALPEGLGGFADAGNVAYVVVSRDEGEAQVVAVPSGEVTREATTEFDAIAIPMRVRDGETLVDDPIVDRARYFFNERVAVFASVSAGPFSFREGDELTVEFTDPAEIMNVAIAVDGDRTPLETEFDPSTGTATATLESDLEAGRHIATIVVTHTSGRIYPEAIIFEAAAP